MSIWDFIQEKIRKLGYPNFRLESKAAVSGGDINQAFKVQSTQQSFFVKINSDKNFALLEQEFNNLQCLVESACFKVPLPYYVGVYKSSSLLIMEYLNLSQQGSMESFANSLLKLHNNTADNFGFKTNNFIGTTPQQNHWHSSWGDFFCENRLIPQFNLLSQKVDVSAGSSNFDSLVKKLPEFLNRHQPKPAFVHGDLWQGNYGFDSVGTPVIYDPASYYGDSEVDLAMLELFGNPGKAFTEHYSRGRGMSAGFPLRKRIYNLYHILNHANLFGAGYVSQSIQWFQEINEAID